MTEVSHLTWMLMTEGLVLLAVLSAALLLIIVRARAKSRGACALLVEHLHLDQEQRDRELRNWLGTRKGYTPEQCEQTQRHLTQLEMRLYEDILNGCSRRDKSRVAQIKEDVTQLVMAYRELSEVQARLTEEGRATKVSDAHSEQHLVEENLRLKDELRITLETMDKMLQEYTPQMVPEPTSDPDSQSVELDVDEESKLS